MTKIQTDDHRSPTTMQIMGLDLSINGTGVCLPDQTTYTIKCNSGQGDTRLTIIRDRIKADLAGVELVVLEDLPTKLQAAASKALGLVQGAIRSALLDAGVPYAVVSPNTLKKFATGRGNCDKAGMILAAYKRAGIEFRDDNQCDAYWLHMAGQDRYADHPPFGGLPATQRSALDVVAWPLGLVSSGCPVTPDLQEIK